MKSRFKAVGLMGLAGLLASGAVSPAQTSPSAPDAASQFGAQALVESAELSPDGKHIVYIGPGPGTTNMVGVIDIAAGSVTPILSVDGQPMRLHSCGWSASDRLVCTEAGLVREPGAMVGYSRVFAMDLDGKKITKLGLHDSDRQLRPRQFDGEVIDWLSGTDGKVLMARYYVPESTTGSLTAQVQEGLGVDLVDTRTQKSIGVERPRTNVHYLSDGRGAVRIMALDVLGHDRDHLLTGAQTHYYRAASEKEWHELGTDDADHHGMEPLAVDSAANAVYVLKDLNGRRALYRVSLDGSLKSELVFAHPQVDVRNVVTIGRNGRVIGASYATDKPHIEYFDPVYRNLAASLARAIPKLPLVEIVSTSADEQVLLIYAGSDNDPGRYYLLDRASKHLTEVMPARAELEKTTLAQVRSVSYPAADGTNVPGYLTLPPGVEKPTALPAIVMPHGGPGARDVWGFDWLAQYYANRGFAVLQPNFRGSAGYGNDWFLKNGFVSWKVAIGDIVDGGHWLVSQGIADPAKLAIVGWSYGGYAALQANVVDPDLFKAVVAVAPVTDLQMLKEQFEGFMNAHVEREFIGSGPHIEEGSPARHADAFKAPVMIFSGDSDANVDVAESRAMDKALRHAGKRSELTVYPKLDHQLRDNKARADMLRRSDEFLRTNLKILPLP